MRTLVVDASIAVKWVVQEDDTPQALALRRGARLVAPELLAAECANVLWKKVQRSQLTADQAALAAQLLERADIELMPMRTLMRSATRIAIELGHATYDCFYLALAVANDWPFVTGDASLMRKLARASDPRLAKAGISLMEAANRP